MFENDEGRSVYDDALYYLDLPTIEVGVHQTHYDNALPNYNCTFDTFIQFRQ